MVYETGHCYLLAALPGHVDSVENELGLWPSVEDILETSSSLWLPTAELQRILMEVVDGRFHCRRSEFWVVDALMMKGNFASTMACAAGSMDRKRGSLAERLYQEHVSLPLPECFSAEALSAKVGGEVVGNNTAYWNAVGIYLSILPALVEVYERSDDKMLVDFVRQVLGFGGGCVEKKPIDCAIESQVSEDGCSEGSNLQGSVSGRTLRNREKRRKAKLRKERKRAPVPSDPVDSVPEVVPEWRRKDVAKSDVHPMGFWKNCSDEVRQQLIDSKARMHIAENERKTREAMNRVAYLDSPQAIVDEVTRMINRAENLAQKQGDAKILGWAKTVTNSSAESLARSAPSTVPTFESVSTRVDEANALENFKRDCAAKENLAKVHQECDERGRKIEDLESKYAACQAKIREFEKAELARKPKVSSLLRENGVPYDLGTARAWVARYAHMKALRDSTKSYVQMAVASQISVDEVRKYFHLKREFSL